MTYNEIIDRIISVRNKIDRDTTNDLLDKLVLDLEIAKRQPKPLTNTTADTANYADQFFNNHDNDSEYWSERDEDIENGVFRW
mgnify:CR=1 FL=1